MGWRSKYIRDGHFYFELGSRTLLVIERVWGNEIHNEMVLVSSDDRSLFELENGGLFT